jgi:serine/threonine protein kinase
MVADQWLGAELAGYRIEALIGRGGAGVVYRATHLPLHRPAAVKLLAPGLAADADYRRRFEREARVAAALEHPHIVPIYDAGYAEGVLYLAMRYIDGPNLATVIHDDGPMDLHRACELLTGVAEALDSAHHAGLVHRDVKPANVLLTTPGQPAGRQHAYLCDFGIARQSSSTLTTATGEFLGTLQYAAPEQIQGRPVDGRTDQYALACVAYHCLTGQVPYPADEPAAVMFAHISAEPPRASTHNPAVPPAVDDIIARALAKQPTDRFPDCTTFLRALATIDDTTSPALPPPPSPPVPDAPPTVIWPPDQPPTEEHSPTPSAAPGRRPHRARLLLGLPLVSLLILAAVLWALPSQETNDPTPPPPTPQAAPQATISPPPPSIAPAIPIGDPRLADHCAFLNPAVFAGFGNVYAGPRIDGYFNQCVLYLSLATGGQAEVAVSFVNTTRPLQGRTEQRGPLLVIRAAAERAACPRNILLPEQTTVVVSALVHDGPTDVCAITDVGTENAVRVLLESGVPQLSSLGDANSLRQQNACAIVDDQTLRRVPALDPTRRSERFGSWGCSWGNDPHAVGFQPPAVDLFFQWVDPLTTANGERIRLAERDVYIRRGVGGNDQPACYARVVHRNHALSDGQRAQEIVVLAVYAAVPEAEQCQLARDVATAVIAKLPPP